MLKKKERKKKISSIYRPYGFAERRTFCSFIPKKNFAFVFYVVYTIQPWMSQPSVRKYAAVKASSSAAAAADIIGNMDSAAKRRRSWCDERLCCDEAVCG